MPPVPVLACNHVNGADELIRNPVVRMPGGNRSERLFDRSWWAVARSASLSWTALALTIALAPKAAAQQRSVSVQGRVEGADARSLPGAMIEVRGTRWQVRTGREGLFNIPLPPGRWTLITSHIGFRPDTLEVTVAGSPLDGLRIALKPVAQQLSGVTVEAPGAQAMSYTVTPTSVRQTPALVEPDVFRAVVGLPMVAQPNDLKGRIHLAGGASDETGVALDGHPLQDPFHLLGLTSAFNVALLDRAEVMMHDVPASVPGRLSGVIDLQTRRASDTPSREIVASMLATSISMGGIRLPLGIDLLAGGRVTYLDKLLRLASSSDGKVAGSEVPLVRYHDGLIRLGRPFGDVWRLEGLAFTTEDELGVSDRERASGHRPLQWGETLVGLRLQRSGARWSGEVRASGNRAVVQLDSGGRDLTWIDVRRDWATAALEIARRATTWDAVLGGVVHARRHVNAWRAGGRTDDIFSPAVPITYASDEAHTEGSVFLEATRQAGPRRLTGSARFVTSAGRWYWAPRLLGVAEHGSYRFEGAISRRYQFTAESEEPQEGSVTAPMFLLRDPRIADVTVLSAQRSFSRSPERLTGQFRAEGFYKRYRERPVLADSQTAEAFPAFDRVRASSIGFGASVRASTVAGATVQAAYTFQRVRDELDGGSYPSGWDAPHQLSLSGGIPVGRKWTVALTYLGHSGRAVTPVEARVFIPGPEIGYGLRGRFLRGSRNSVRVPAYHRVDASARRSWTLRGAEWSGFVQVLNVLNAANAVDYTWEQYLLAGTGSRPSTARAGLPILPTIGIEVAW